MKNQHNVNNSTISLLLQFPRGTTSIFYSQILKKIIKHHMLKKYNKNHQHKLRSSQKKISNSSRKPAANNKRFIKLEKKLTIIESLKNKKLSTPMEENEETCTEQSRQKMQTTPKNANQTHRSKTEISKREPPKSQVLRRTRSDNNEPEPAVENQPRITQEK